MKATVLPDHSSMHRSKRLRSAHTEQVIAVLRLGPAKRSELSARTGLCRATVSSIVGELRDHGVVVSLADLDGRRIGPGRPSSLVALAERNVRSLGISFRRDGLHTALGNPLHRTVGIADRSHRRGLNWGDRTDLAIESVYQLCNEHGVDLAPLNRIGVGVPGPVPTQGGTWNTVVRRLSREFDARITVDNNLRLTALAEANWGAAKGHETALYFHLGEGVGGGLVLNGTLYQGFTGAAMELGHVPVCGDDRACPCGKHGCLELSAGLPAVLRAAGVRRNRLPKLGVNPAVNSVLMRVVEVCAPTISFALTILDVSKVVVGGLLAYCEDRVRTHFTESVRPLLLPGLRSDFRVEPAVLGEEAGVLGCLALSQQDSPLLRTP